jgi:hypothetical protein
MGSMATEQHSSPHGGGGVMASRPTRCLLLLQRCLAIRLQRTSCLLPPPPHCTPPKPGHEYWMYESGYRLFQVCYNHFTLIFNIK